MGMEEIVKEVVKPDYATPALYFFSALAETMGALLAIVLTALYAIVPSIYQRTNNMSSEVLIRLMHNDKKQLWGIIFGAASICISLILILVIQSIDITNCFLVFLEIISILVSAISICLIVLFVRTYRKYNHLLSYINDSSSKEVSKYPSIDLVECYILSDAFYPCISNETEYRTKDIIQSLKKYKAFPLNKLFNNLHSAVNIWHKKRYSTSDTEENNDLYLILFKTLVFFYFSVEDSIKQRDIKSFSELLSCIRKLSGNKLHEADEFFKKYFADHVQYLNSAILSEDIDLFISKLHSYLHLYESLLGFDINYSYIIKSLSGIQIKHKAVLFITNKILIIDSLMFRIINLFYTSVDNEFSKDMFSFQHEEQEIFRSISRMHGNDLFTSSIFNNAFNSIKNKEIIICIPYMLNMSNFNNEFNGYKFKNINLKRVSEIISRACTDQIFTRRPNVTNNSPEQFRVDIERYLVEQNKNWSVDNSSSTEFIKSQ